ncbi:tRNA glutamyl-Q(34) synthetase GluQRS [Psychromonas hadalis]|uniref:tRNA glutamyl-Q(34) synthetase GluQRS n=1 Tax=Psychromonas hadalis TaxID=211669 RepID=UPI0003B5AD32|nr:tRNA glutamyl-Q(34) synthetase GluQRS [Psychromonas hadalis]
MSLYIGRFAPSPSGPLHFGSLVAALGSYLQAKSVQGKWLVRIEDIDPPREIAGASADILATLQAYGLQWDDEVVYQSQQSARYEQVLASLSKQQLSYGCCCTRKLIKMQGGLYRGNCRDKKLSEKNNAVRINIAKLSSPITRFQDQLQGDISLDKQQANEDFIIRRKDDLYAYNLAVVIDDIEQGITEVVRGADLLATTGKQISLYQLLKEQSPTYLHLPLAVTEPGLKLSKQNHALAIDKENPIPTLLKALFFLGHPVPKQVDKNSCETILNWAIKNWCLSKLPKQTEIQIEK